MLSYNLDGTKTRSAGFGLFLTHVEFLVEGISVCFVVCCARDVIQSPVGNQNVYEIGQFLFSLGFTFNFALGNPLNFALSPALGFAFSLVRIVSYRFSISPYRALSCTSASSGNSKQENL